MKNILLLAMSTLNSSKSKALYRHINPEENVEFYFWGISQLEAGTKLVMTELAGKDEKLDRIIVLNTKATYPGINVDASDRQQAGEESAYSYYKNRIRAFVKDEEYDPYHVEVLKAARDKGLETVGETRLIDSVHYTDEELDALFCSVNIEKKYFYLDAVRKILEIQENADEKICLYQDMQGGDRNANFQMNAVTQLLDTKDVTIVAKYATKYNRNSSYQDVFETSSMYTQYDLINAMQAFKKYGRGEMLLEYLDKQQIKSERDRTLIKAIKQASDGIRLCDMNEFERALVNIKAVSEQYGSSMETDLDIVFKQIYEDYGTLLDNPHGNYLERVKWCYRKGFYQQALTIIESQMPEGVFADRILTVKLVKQSLYYSSTQQWVPDPEALYPLEEEDRSKPSVAASMERNGTKKKYQSMEHWLFEKWASESAMLRDSNNQIVDMVLDGNTRKQWRNAISGISMDNATQMKAVEDLKKKKKNPAGAGPDKREFKVLVTLKPGKEAEIRMFARLHMSLKKQRNSTNHSLRTDRISVDQLEDALASYIEVGENIGLH